MLWLHLAVHCIVTGSKEQIHDNNEHTLDVKTVTALPYKTLLGYQDINRVQIALAGHQPAGSGSGVVVAMEMASDCVYYFKLANATRRRLSLNPLESYAEVA